MSRLREHLSYANVMATIAVFIALGGTSYALTRNSVGAKEIRPRAVGASEIRSGAVRSKEIKNRASRLRDISIGARGSLRGQPGPAGPQGPAGPPGVPFTAAVEAGGRVRSSTAAPVTNHQAGTGVYDVVFNRDLRPCYSVATLTGPNTGEIATEPTEHGVVVRTRNSSGQPADLPFDLIAVC